MEHSKETLLETNRANKTVLEGLVEEFSNEYEFVSKKTEHFLENSPFNAIETHLDKIFSDIYDQIEAKKAQIKGSLANVRKVYESNLKDNENKLSTFKNMAKDTLTAINTHLEECSDQDPYEYCEKDLSSQFTHNTIETCKTATAFQQQEFSRLKQNFVDTNTVVFNDANKEIEKAKQLREFLTDKLQEFAEDSRKWTAKNVYTVIMNMREFIVYLPDETRIIKVTYDNDFVIPNYSRWINVTGSKLLLCGGGKDNIKSSDHTYVFHFGDYDPDTESISAKVLKKADMKHPRRAHALAAVNDYIYAVSGVDNMSMVGTVERYDTHNDTWEELPSLNEPRQNAALAVHNLRFLYAFGGYNGYGNLNSFELMDTLEPQKGWQLVGASKIAGEVDLRKNRMGVIPLDFDRILIFGGENKNQEYKESYVFEFYENKFYPFGDLARTSNFVMEPVYYSGKYVMFDFLNNIHTFSLDTLDFEYHVFQREDEIHPNL